MIDNHTLPAGLTYIEEFITPETEQTLIEKIGQSQWMNDLKRRVQHYGYRYDYRARNIAHEDFLGQLPSWLSPLVHQLIADKVFAEPPDQVIINEYEPGQGIAPHIDCVPCFEDTIVSLSLVSGCEMNFKELRKNGFSSSLYLNQRSLLILKNEARFEWTHGIAPRKSDLVDNIRMPRSRRLSLTFRRVII